ncbi:DNase I-like protein [Peniophora sp. CONT]|nr:DNase I-like protein [Peniophora sp. CONT]
MIWQLMREKRIGVLALQETHLTADQAESLSGQYRRLRFFVSPTPEPFVLNKDVVDASDDNVTFEVIVPGRAATLAIGWHATRRVSILNIYAPANSPVAKRAFFSDLYDSWPDSERWAPDVMLGDFNLVESSIDRFPPHLDDAAATTALSRLVTLFRLHDGYRRTYPTTPTFTFERTSDGILTTARLDRAYVSDDILSTAHSWSVAESPIPSDHKLISFTLVDEKLPFIALTDETFLRGSITPETRSSTNNAPLIWKRDFKDKNGLNLSFLHLGPPSSPVLPARRHPF